MKRSALFRSAISWIPLLVLQGAALPLAADPGSAALPWAIGSPAAAGPGARFGLGLHYDFEERDDWESSATGVQVPLALSCFRLKDSLCLFPTLTLEAASVDVTLNPGSGNPLHGSGDLFGAGLDVAFALCESCPGFVSGGYQFRTIPGVDLQGGGSGDPRLSRDVHVASARLGYVLPGNRFAPYVGLRGQWRDAEIGIEPRREKLESEVTEGILGVDARLWGPMYGRLEIMAGGPDRDCSVQVNLAWVGPNRTEERAEVLKQTEKQAKAREKAEERQRREKLERFTAIAAELIPQLARILDDFRAGWRALQVVEGPDGEPAYLAEEVDALLLRNENALLDLLAQYQELEPLADWVRDRFREARVDLGLEPAKVASLSFQVAQMRRALSKVRTDENVDGIIKPLRKIVRDGKFWTRFIFRASLGPGHQIDVYPIYKRRDPAFTITLSPGDDEELVYGDYSFAIYKMGAQAGATLRQCDAVSTNRYERSSPCPLKLMNRPRFVLRCDPSGCASKKWRERE